MIPGTKSPAGTHTPYVMIVRTYQVHKKIDIVFRSAFIPPGPSKLLSIDRKESPYELKNKVANGLNVPSGQS